MASKLGFRLLKRVGLNFSEGEYGNASLWFMFKRLLKRYKNAILLKYCMFSIILTPINYRLIRPLLWRWMGCKVGKNVFIGYEVLLDTSYTELIEIEDNVHITNRCLLLCHQRDMTKYSYGNDITKLSYIKGKITLKRGCFIGMNTMILPGVTIGEGAVIGACSLVTKDIPAWTIAAGVPAKVIRYVRNESEK